MDLLVTTDWLAEHLKAEDLVVLDASSHLPAATRDPATEFVGGHIPGARFLDLPGLKDANSDVPAALPTADQFTARMRALGVRQTDRVVLYDDSALRTSARAFFIFTMFGFENVALLDGGLGKWTAEARATECSATAPVPSTFTAVQDNRSRVRSKANMLDNINTGSEQVVDARDAGRFTADIEDTVHGLAGGHIPGARNLHFVQLLQQDGTFKDTKELRTAFEGAGIDLDGKITGTCGSGITASVVLFALELLGHKGGALYDGSWGEWGADGSTPKETGPAT